MGLMLLAQLGALQQHAQEICGDHATAILPSSQLSIFFHICQLSWLVALRWQTALRPGTTLVTTRRDLAGPPYQADLSFEGRGRVCFAACQGQQFGKPAQHTLPSSLCLPWWHPLSLRPPPLVGDVVPQQVRYTLRQALHAWLVALPCPLHRRLKPCFSRLFISHTVGGAPLGTSQLFSSLATMSIFLQCVVANLCLLPTCVQQCFVPCAST